MKKLHLPSTIPHCIWGIPTHTKGKPKMLGSSTLFPPKRQFFPDNFWEQKKRNEKKQTPLYPEKKKPQFSCFPFLIFKRKISWRFWDTRIQRGNYQPTIPSLYKLASSNPHPQVPRTIASSVTSRCESLCFLLVSTVSIRKEAQSFGVSSPPTSTQNYLSKIKIQD